MALAGRGYVFPLMKTPHALGFLLTGLAMGSCPAIFPEYFTDGHARSGIWLMLMGALQASLGLTVFGFTELPRLTGWLAAWEPVDLSLALPDIHWSVPGSVYALLDEAEEVTDALRLQQQLRQVA